MIFSPSIKYIGDYYARGFSKGKNIFQNPKLIIRIWNNNVSCCTAIDTIHDLIKTSC